VRCWMYGVEEMFKMYLTVTGIWTGRWAFIWGGFISLLREVQRLESIGIID
jgi:hypothetical protein